MFDVTLKVMGQTVTYSSSDLLSSLLGIQKILNDHVEKETAAAQQKLLAAIAAGAAEAPAVGDSGDEQPEQ